MSDPERVFLYHERTKHYPMRYARSLGHLDWENQPDPFRSFEGSERLLLPFDLSEEGPSLHALDREGPAPLASKSVARLLELSLAISAWKQLGDSRWALRVNPSSGNLHPTEGYLWLPPVERLAREPGVYHYRPADHALERRAVIPDATWRAMSEPFGAGAFFVGFSSIHWREAWKYGERAFRYCQHDLGHAIGALAYAAATLGWRVRVLRGIGSADLAALMGTERDADFEDAEREEAEAIAVVSASGAAPSREALDAWPPQALVGELRSAAWLGRANVLSRDRVDWPVIDVIAEETRKPAGATSRGAAFEAPPSVTDPLDAGAPAARVIRRRRSAVDFDGKSTMPRSTFFAMLDRVLPRDAIPFDALDDAPRVHLAMFVHRVVDVRAGLYMLVRDPAAKEPLARATRPEFEWAAVEGAPAHLPLFRLREGDMTGWGRSISCHQDIAGDGVFSLGMIADFERPCRETGPWMYRRLFWETGVIGQALYLETEAAGLRATGIGCFFDDSMHELLGLRGRAFQSLYHLAVGGAVDDPRLTTLPAYPDAEGRRL